MSKKSELSEDELTRAISEALQEDVEMEDVPEPQPKKKRGRPPKPKPAPIEIPKSIERSHQLQAVAPRRATGIYAQKKPATQSQAERIATTHKEEPSFMREVGKEIVSKLGVLAVSVGGLLLLAYLQKGKSEESNAVQEHPTGNVHKKVENYEKLKQQTAFPEW